MSKLYLFLGITCIILMLLGIIGIINAGNYPVVPFDVNSAHNQLLGGGIFSILLAIMFASILLAVYLTEKRYK